MSNLLRRCTALSLSILLVLMPLSTARAEMIGNDQIFNQDRAHQVRDNLKQEIEKDTVRQQLHAWGVTPDQIKNRIDSLTDDEVAQIYQQIDDPKVGSGAVGILLTVLLVFVITDIIGATDIFPFINPIN